MVLMVKLVKGVTAAVGCGIFVSFLPQTIGLQKYRETLSNYTYGDMTPLDSHTISLIDKVMDDMKLDERKRSLLQYFVCFDNNPITKGSSSLKTGAILGLPPTMKYCTVEDVTSDQNTLTVGSDQTHVAWDTDSGIRLSDALVLSDKAKSFLIAREIQFSRTYHLYVDLFTKLFFFSAGYGGIYGVNLLLGMNSAIPAVIGLGVCALVGSIFTLAYLLVIDTYFCWRDTKVDQKTARMSLDIAEGGLEYYQKTLSRNIAIRDQLGPKLGAKVYTMYGNEVGMLRTRHAPLTGRRDLLQKCILLHHAHTDDNMAVQDNST